MSFVSNFPAWSFLGLKSNRIIDEPRQALEPCIANISLLQISNSNGSGVKYSLNLAADQRYLSLKLTWRTFVWVVFKVMPLWLEIRFTYFWSTFSELFSKSNPFPDKTVTFPAAATAATATATAPSTILLIANNRKYNALVGDVLISFTSNKDIELEFWQTNDAVFRNIWHVGNISHIISQNRRRYCLDSSHVDLTHTGWFAWTNRNCSWIKVWLQTNSRRNVPRHNRTFGEIVGHQEASQDSTTTFWASWHWFAVVRQTWTSTFFVQRMFVVSMSLWLSWVLRLSCDKYLIVGTRRKLLVKQSYDCHTTVARLFHDCRATVARLSHEYYIL